MNLSRTDKKMERVYKGDSIVYEFKEGDQVYVKTRKIGKLFPKAQGPFVFVKYTGKNCKSALVDVGNK